MQVIPIQATDQDAGKNAAIAFNLLGDESRDFSIDKNTGIIKTSSKASIDFELKESYSFWVSATDEHGAGMTVHANVSITVLDLNDNIPAFSSAKYHTAVPESVNIEHFLIRLNASDSDSGYFGSVSYLMVSGSDGKFSIDAKTGVIRTQNPLDREKRDFYILSISAYDGGIPQNVGYSAVLVNVTDVNDNFPVFINAQSEVSILESAAIGTSITRVQAIDADLNEDAHVRYSITGEKFDIDTLTGVIKTSAKLDREAVDHYFINVTARDSVGHQSNFSMMIRVDDINDNRPRFLTANPTTIDIFEKTPKGSIVAIVEAVDEDNGMNGRIEYTMSEKSGNLLRIDNKIGVLR